MNPPADVVHRPEEANPDTLHAYRLSQVETQIAQIREDFEARCERMHVSFTRKIERVESRLFFLIVGQVTTLLTIIGLVVALVGKAR